SSSSGPKCQGQSKPCDSNTTEKTCLEHAACHWKPGTCMGALGESCRVLDGRQQDCESVASFAWQIGDGGAGICDGLNAAQNCDAIHDQNFTTTRAICESFQSCTYIEGTCDGYVSTCDSETSESACNGVPGCHWQ